MAEQRIDGVIVVDKPPGWTSHDVVNKLRRLAKERRIGHLGTLDPLATGVLPLLVGRATRLARFFDENDKRYDARIRFGIETDSYDRDGAVVAQTPCVDLTRDRVDRELEAFRGRFVQTPPPVSAKKIAGRPAYELARKKIEVKLEPVLVTVHSLELVEFDADSARILVHCAGGTYVRAIAHDLGHKLGCGAILDGLRRTSSGGFDIVQAYTLPALEQLAAEDRIGEAMIPAAHALPQFPSERMDAVAVAQIRQGRDFRVSPFRAAGSSPYVKAIAEDGSLIAVGQAILPNLYHPILVF